MRSISTGQLIGTRNTEDRAAGVTWMGACSFCDSWMVFAAYQAGEVVKCPHCQKETVLHLRGTWSAERPDRCAFEFRTLRWEASALGYRYLSGELHNASEHAFNWVRVEFRLFDGSDLFLTVATDSVTALEPGGSWHFKALVFDPSAARASLPVLSTEFGKLHFDLTNPQGANQPDWEISQKRRGLLAPGLAAVEVPLCPVGNVSSTDKQDVEF